MVSFFSKSTLEINKRRIINNAFSQLYETDNL